MIKKSCIILVKILLVCISFAQEIQFKEKATAGYTRFFYDDNYYLVDKNCEFKAIERVAQYDTVNFKFNGEFKDFNLNGRLILQGAYKNGLKHGAYKAYHPNGQLKWETVYIEGKESGEWRYYYPDGKPMLTLSLDSGDFKFINFWDTFGIQKIKNGEGTYEMLLQLKGFTDHGFTSYIRKGQITNSKPEGRWITYLVDNQKKRIRYPLFYEQFVQGIQKSLITDSEFIDYYIPYEDFPLVPSHFFERAESFVVNGCTFDEYSGFLNFITRKINEYLSDYKFETDNANFQYSVKYGIDRKGLPTSIKSINKDQINIPIKDKNNIADVFESMVYIIPSISDGKSISDNVTLTGDFIINNGTTTLHHLKIEREKGQ